MNSLYKDITKHTETSKKARLGGESLHQGILKEMKRIDDINSIKFDKGDHYVFEEYDYSWLL